MFNGLLFALGLAFSLRRRPEVLEQTVETQAMRSKSGQCWTLDGLCSP